MNILATFIGINRYSNSNIRDLSGAAKDATALWALFEDSVPGMNGKLLLDEHATAESIREVFDTTLGTATSEDVVILFFAGHGSHDNRLIVHDTNDSEYEGTTIPMSELADRFKQSKAGTILCILDCCFSGGAPARVMENSPTARASSNPFSEISGKGRILLAASNYDQESYEFGAGDHGLLTKAIINALQDESEQIDLPTALSSAMKEVLASAARIGVKQTPVMLGHFEGSLVFPVLKPGKHFAEAFPESKGIRITSAIEDLSSFGIPTTVLNEWSERFDSGLNNLQVEAINEYRILDGKSLFLVAPTSSGKTFVGELSSIMASLRGQKTVFLLPYKALTNEKYEQFSSLYGDELGLRVIRCTGDRLDDVNSFIRGKYDIALLTYEMFLGLALSNPVILNQIGLVVVDEGQFITDPNRGITVELLLTYLLTARERGVEPQLIILSAVVGSTNSFENWIDCEKLIWAERPVPLIEGVLDRSGVFEYKDVDGSSKTRQMLPRSSIVQRRDKPSSQDVIVPLVRQLIEANPSEQIIIFRNRKGPAAGCAAYLAKDLGLPAANDAINQLPTLDLSANSARLRECLQGGTAFHNTNLSPEEKEVVEKGFRNKDGKIRVLGATTTVAAGINTPASTVILAEQEFVGDDGRTFTIAEYKNMAGRAGRLGYRENGTSIILAEHQFERAHLFRKYVFGELEPITSSFDPQQIETWIIRLLAQVGAIRREQVTKLLANTYGGYLASRTDPDWGTRTQERLEILLEEFISLGLVEQNVDDISLTVLGKVCGQSSLSFKSAMKLIKLLQDNLASGLSIQKLAAVVQGLPELDRTYTPVAKAGRRDNPKIVQSETQWPNRAAALFGSEVVNSLQRNAENSLSWYARCKRSLMLMDWIEGVSVEDIEQRFTATPFYAIEYGHIHGIVSTTRFHLRAAVEIATVMLSSTPLFEDDLEVFLKRLEVGLPSEALDLLEIPVLLTRGEYLTLLRNGTMNVADLWALSKDGIDGILGQARAKELEAFRRLDGT